VVTGFLLSARRKLPVRLASFLDDAYRLGILCQSGAVYQFRNATLQDHLIATYEASDPMISCSEDGSPTGSGSAARHTRWPDL